MANRVAKSRPAKPSKPYAEFPLFAHASGRWCKKIRGRFHYFGPWGDPDAALELYLDQKDDLFAGRRPRPKDEGGITIQQLCNSFLTSKELLVESGDLKRRTWNEYHRCCQRLVDVFGKHRRVDDLEPRDFDELRSEIAKTYGPTSLGNEVNRCRMIFKYGYDTALVETPVRFGQNFKRPAKRLLRKTRSDRGPRMFTADELRRILAAAGMPMKAMVLLAINGGLGQTDLAELSQTALSRDMSWLDHPRPKTGIARKVPLLKETVSALKVAIADRPNPVDPADDELVFLTRHGKKWVRLTPNNSVYDAIWKEFNKLLRDLGIKRNGLAFYALRHTFRTIADQTRDFPAIDLIMGHGAADDDMAARYREEISDDRLVAVVEHVHNWLFPPEKKKTPKRAKKRK
jgi:integrase